MFYTQIFNAIGGFGLFLFSLRFLNIVLTNLISNRLKVFTEKIFSSYIQCTIFGVATTFLIQASSVTIVTSMALLNNSFISLEQSIFIMLGASLGTTIKGLIFAKSIYSYGSLLIGITSIILIFVKNELYRDFIKFLFCIGLSFVGFNIMSESLKMISIKFSDIIIFRNDNIIISLLIGLLLTIFLQSSSTVLFLVIELANQNMITFPVGVAVVLGANIGTTSTVILVSLEYEKNVKRLALSYFMVKFIGVFITIIFFPSFLSFVKLFNFSNSIGIEIALANTIFNLINVIWWHIFYPFLIKFAFFIIPSTFRTDKKDDTMIISKMISNSVDITFQEIEIQMSKAINITKIYTDKFLEILINSNEIKYKYEIIFEDIKKIKTFVEQTLFEMFIKNNCNKEYINKIKKYIYFINTCNNICLNVTEVIKILKKGLYIENFIFPDDLKPFIEEFESSFNNIWLIIILNKEEEINVNELNQKILNIEIKYFEILSKNKLKKENITWIYDIIFYLKIISDLLFELSKIKKTDFLYKNIIGIYE